MNRGYRVSLMFASLVFMTASAAWAGATDGFLEYLSTSGSKGTGQRIDLDYVPSGNTIIRAKFTPNVVDGNGQCLFCARTRAANTADALNFNYFAAVSKKPRFDYFTTLKDMGEALVKDTPYTVELIRKRLNVMSYLYKGTANYPTRTQSIGYELFSAGGPMSLFQSYVLQDDGSRGGWADSANLKFHYLKVYEWNGEQETLQMCLVPRQVGETVGLYDCVAGKFYANVGEGSFEAGPALSAQAAAEYAALYNPSARDWRDPIVRPDPSLENVIYVATTGSDSSADPYSEATPLATILKAVELAKDGDTIYVKPGRHDYNGTVAISKPITLMGAGRHHTILTRTKLELKHANAVVSDLRLSRYGSSWSMSINSGATVRRCEISDNTRTSTTGTGVGMSCGSLIDSIVTDNRNTGGGNGVGVFIETQGDCLIENCRIAENTTWNHQGVGGLYICNKYGFNNFNVTVRNTVIAGNCGGDAGGVSLNGNCNILFEDCTIADNCKYKDATTSQTEDATLNWSAGYTRTFRRCVIQKCPSSYNKGYVFEDCVVDAGAGLYDPYNGDYTVSNASPIWSTNTSALAVNAYAQVRAGTGRVATTLVGRALNASANVVFDWDLDGDGTYETSGATAEVSFATPGWHGVSVRATDGSASASAFIPHLVYVAPQEVFVWTKSPHPTFPYATWETAAHNPHLALAAALDGGRVQFTNEAITVGTPLKVFRKIEVAGTGKDNNSILGGVGGFTVTQVPDENATGTSVQRTTGDVNVLQVFGTGALVHSFAFGPGRDRVANLFGESVISNCVIRYGEYTGGNGNGISASAGLITHCVISNNYNYNACSGGEAYLTGTARLYNSLVTGGKHTAIAAPGCKGAVYAQDSAQVMNCTIIGNQAGYGAGLYTTGNKVKIYNNIIRDNSTTCDPSSHPDWCDETGTGDYRNNCMAVAHADGDGTVTAAPGFILDEVTGLNTWTFGSGSPCVNAGLNQDWMTDATDFFGHTRVQGDVVDIGMFEADLSKATCGILATPESATGETDVTLKAVVVGKTMPDETRYLWDVDGDGEYEREGLEVTVRFGAGYHTAKLKVMVGEKVEFEVEGKGNLVTIYPKVFYFDTANAEGAVFPYDTPETAAAKMSEALSTLTDGAEMRVLAGVHPCDAQLLINRRVVIKAAEGLAEKPTLKRKFDGSSFVAIGNPAARIEGLVFDDNRYYSQNVVVNDGTITDCVISNGYYTSGGSIGLEMAGGLVDRCTIVHTRGTVAHDANVAGLVASVRGGTLRNSLFVGNYCDTANDGRWGGLVCARGQGVVESCTFTENTNRFNAIVTTMEGGTVRNCVIFNNFTGDTNVFECATAPSYVPLKRGYNNTLELDTTGEADFDYNAYSSASGMVFGAHDVLLVNSPFVERVTERNPKHSLAANAPCLNAGERRDWMTAGAVDLIGNPRVMGGRRPDMGCYECQKGSGMAIIVR